MLVLDIVFWKRRVPMNFLMHTGKAECFDPVFSLMEQAFPPCERRNREGQLRVAKHPAYSYRILEDEQGDFLGFLAVWHFGSFRLCHALFKDTY